MYTVKVLSEKEFDKLPYKHTKTSLGLADAKSGVAYVRDTGYNDITKDTIAHELDELMQSVSPHEVDGIRYKNLKSLGAGAGAGLLSSFVPALRPFTPAISAGAGALAGGKGNRLQGALQGFGGGGLGAGLQGGASGALKGLTSPGGTFGNALKAFLPGAGSGVQQFAGQIPGFGGVGTGTPTGALAKFFQGAGAPSITSAQLASNAARGAAQGSTGLQAGAGGGTGSGILSAFGNLLGGGQSVSPSVGGGSDGGSKGILSKFGIGDALQKVAPGLAIAGIGDLLAPKVTPPDTSGIQNRLEEQLRTGGEPLAKEAGLQELFRILGEPIGAPPSAAFNQGDFFAKEQLDDDLTSLSQQFKQVNPNANVANTSALLDKQEELKERSRILRGNARDELSFQFEREQIQQKAQAMQVALNLDQAQMSQFINLAQLEVNQLMQQYGIDVETATRFKQMFSDFGQLAAGGGQQDNAGLDSLFQAAANSINQGGA